MTPALEMLEEMRERAENAFDGDYSLNVIANSDVPKLISFAIAVLEMPAQANADKDGFYRAGQVSGYNQCLAEVKATIEGKVNG